MRVAATEAPGPPIDCGGAPWRVTASDTGAASTLRCEVGCAGALWLHVSNCGDRDLAVVGVSVIPNDRRDSGVDNAFATDALQVGAGAEKDFFLDGPIGDGDLAWDRGTYVVHATAILVRSELDPNEAPQVSLDASATFTHAVPSSRGLGPSRPSP